MQTRASPIRIAITRGVITLAVAGCSSDDPRPPPVVTALAVSIDADNHCTLEEKSVECRRVASVIQSRYPTSKPRVDICLDKGTRYEAALEVMNSVSAAGLPVGDFTCKSPG